jgi:uncharacterized protein YndB with AHSA1/START domain
MKVSHATLELTRLVNASPAAIFAAYVDPRVREVWAAPSPTAELTIDAGEVRTGGEERGRCGPKGDLRWSIRTRYHLVVPDRHISFTEELWEGDSMLTISLVTFEIQATGAGATVKLTDQILSLVGPDGIAGHRDGYSQALDNLGKHLAAV